MSGRTKTENRTMVITSSTTWTVSKDGQEMHLTPQDLQQILSQLALAGDLVVFDQGGCRCWSGGQIEVGLDNDAVQVVLTEGEKSQTSSEEVPAIETEEAELRKNVLSILAKKTATRRHLRDWFGPSKKAEREMLDRVLADLRAEGVADVSHRRFRLRKAQVPRSDDASASVSGPADYDDETFTPAEPNEAKEC